MCQKEGNGNLHTVLRSRRYMWLTSGIFHHPRYAGRNCAQLKKEMYKLTPCNIAGSSGGFKGAASFTAGTSSILKSLTSEPRNTMYSYRFVEGSISSAGFPLRPSVPKDVTFSSATVESCELISCKVPTYLAPCQSQRVTMSACSSYRMSLFDTRDIRALEGKSALSAKRPPLSID